ncbi:DUF4440 domain-containing protein [Croceitalea sp. MTPC9]|nr:DUF4440 domain-containing protein [Croceitalea sp. MTPC6]GMN17599.1 DUF4440 domain-containing protein [Croceitalea sp. MTPC9]
MTFKLRTVLATLTLVITYNLDAQSNTETEFFKTLKMADSLLFDVGFNECNLQQVAQLVGDDIEFYHDKDGITKSKTKFLASIKDNLCSSGKNMLKRVLDESSLEVFPLYKDGKLYGAIQNGVHNFAQTKASFSHVWLIKKGQWKLSRVLSYNHHQEQDTSKDNRITLSTNELKQYIGDYEFSPEFVLTVSLKDGDLYGGAEGQDVKIHCYDKHKFIDDEQTSDLTFLMDDNGTVSGLYMKGSGMEMTAKKR